MSGPNQQETTFYSIDLDSDELGSNRGLMNSTSATVEKYTSSQWEREPTTTEALYLSKHRSQ